MKIRQLSILLPTILLLSFALAAQPDPEIPVERGADGSTIHRIVDQMPRFSGCEESDYPAALKNACANDKLIGFISRNLGYPQEAKERGDEGMVLISFVVDETGKILRPEIKRDIGGGCGMEALRVVGLMPQWIPGMHEGKPVKVRFNLPINFKLGEEETTAAAEKPEYKLFWGMAHRDEIKAKDMELLSTQRVYVRDLFGKNYPINELDMLFEKGVRYKELSSRGELSEQMSKLLKKAGRNAIITFSALIQDEDGFLTIEREFRVR